MRLLFCESPDGEDFVKVDFELPVLLSSSQRQNLLSFLKSIFDPNVVIEEETSEFRDSDSRLGDKLLGSRWDGKEIALLLKSPQDTGYLRDRLGRTWMSVQIRRGLELIKFDEWFANHKIDLKFRYDKEELPKLIEKYLKEEELKRRQKSLAGKKLA